MIATLLFKRQSQQETTSVTGYTKEAEAGVTLQVKESCAGLTHASPPAPNYNHYKGMGKQKYTHKNCMNLMGKYDFSGEIQ